MFHLPSPLLLFIKLTLSQTTNLDAFILKEFAEDNFKFDENDTKCSKR